MVEDNIKIPLTISEQEELNFKLDTDNQVLSVDFNELQTIHGKDGISVTHSWEGTTLIVTSASGTSSANLKGDKGDKGDSIKGEDGKDGYSPIRGIDYWTESDRAEIKAYVDDAILGGVW